MVAEGYRLGSLQMGEAGHDYGIVTLGLIQQAGLQADQLGDDGVDLFAQPEADIGGDLVVT